MIALLTAVGWTLAVVASVPLAVFASELFAGLFPGHRSRSHAAPAATAVLIPAHDEAAGIEATLADLFRVAPAGTHVLVIADNCSDDTAAIARAAGAEVVERHDPAARGKGFALAFGREHLACGAFTPDVVVVLDADCRIAPGAIEALAATAVARGTPVQAVNLIAADLEARPMVQISGFAMLVKNLYRSRGMQRLGGPALLTGTGMAFPWTLFARAELANASIVEDLALGIEMVRAGSQPLLLTEASVSSAPAHIDDALAQRTRWEHGFLQVLRGSALPVLAGGLRRGSLAEVLLGLHLLVPPLALLLLIAAAVLVMLAGLALAGANATPAIVVGSVFGLVLVLVLVAWLFGGRRYLSASALLRAPLYVLWKLPLYAAFLRDPESRWRRTPRRP